MRFNYFQFFVWFLASGLSTNSGLNSTIGSLNAVVMWSFTLYEWKMMVGKMKEKNKACMFIFLVMGHDKDSFLVACNVLYHCLMFNDIKNNKNKNLNYHILYILA